MVTAAVTTREGQLRGPVRPRGGGRAGGCLLRSPARGDSGTGCRRGDRESVGTVGWRRAGAASARGRPGEMGGARAPHPGCSDV